MNDWWSFFPELERDQLCKFNKGEHLRQVAGHYIVIGLVKVSD